MATPIVTTAIKQAQLPAPMCTGRPSISARRQYTTPISKALAATTTDTLFAGQSPLALVLTFSALVEQLGRPDGSTPCSHPPHRAPTISLQIPCQHARHPYRPVGPHR